MIRFVSGRCCSLHTLFLPPPFLQPRLLNKLLLLFSDGELKALLSLPPLLLSDESDPAGSPRTLQVLFDKVHTALTEFGCQSLQGRRRCCCGRGHRVLL